MIVGVWGSSGAGKSTVAIKVALALEKLNKKVILIDTNFIVPQAGIWFPDKEIETNNSISNILSNDISIDILASKLNMVHENIGVLGYAKCELSINSVMQREDTAATLLRLANTLADVVIVDCQTNMTQDILTYTAMEQSEKKLIVMTPDQRGISWYMSNMRVLQDPKYKMKDSVNVISNYKAYNPVDAVEKQVGRVKYMLPFNEFVNLELNKGTLGEPKNHIETKEYMAIIQKLITEELL